jgi:hypothetical protein
MELPAMPKLVPVARPPPYPEALPEPPVPVPAPAAVPPTPEPEKKKKEPRIEKELLQDAQMSPFMTLFSEIAALQTGLTQVTSDFKGVNHVIPNFSGVLGFILTRMKKMKTIVGHSSNWRFALSTMDLHLITFIVLGEMDAFLRSEYTQSGSGIMEHYVSMPIPAELAAMISVLGRCTLSGYPTLVIDYPWFRDKLLTSPKVKAMCGPYAGEPFNSPELRERYSLHMEVIVSRLNLQLITVNAATPEPSLLGTGVWFVNEDGLPPSPYSCRDDRGVVRCVSSSMLRPHEVVLACVLQLWYIDRKRCVLRPKLGRLRDKNIALLVHLTSIQTQGATDMTSVLSIMDQAMVSFRSKRV